MTFLENFTFSSINLVSFGLKVFTPALTWGTKQKSPLNISTSYFTI